MAPNGLLARSALVIAPVGLLGGWLLLRPIGGAGEPGFWWTVAHSVWLVGFLAFVPAGLALRRLAGASRIGDLAAAIIVLSALANAVQMVLDLVAGAVAGSRAEMKTVLVGVSDIGWVDVVVYGIGAQLIFVGLVVMAVLLTARHAVPVAAAVLVGAGVALLAATLAVGRNGWPSPVGDGRAGRRPARRRPDRAPAHRRTSPCVEKSVAYTTLSIRSGWDVAECDMDRNRPRAVRQSMTTRCAHLLELGRGRAAGLE